MKKFIALGITMCLLFLVGCSNQKTSSEKEKDILSKNYKEIEEIAKGTTVNFYGWGGNEVLNKWFDSYVVSNMKDKYDIKVKRVGMDIDNIMNKLMSEKQVKNDKGTIDVFWVNGENFKMAKDNNLLFGPFTNKIENYEKYVDTKSKDITTDFGTDVDNMESPWGKASFTVFKNSSKVNENITDTKTLKESIMKNPGKFTYPAPPDFTGSAFVRNVIYDIVGYEKLKNLSENEEEVRKTIQPAIDYLNEIKPYLWNKGQTYPATIAQLDNMYSDGEVNFSMTYAPNEVEGKINSGEFDKKTEFINFKKGNISNTHFLAIPKNSSNKAGAMVLINYLTSIDAQASKTEPKNWGDMTIIDLDKISKDEKSKFKNSVQLKNQVPEIKASLVPIIEKIWMEEVSKSNE